MTVLEHFRQGRSEPALTPSDLGFEEIDIPVITEADVLQTYLEYRRTGGQPLKFWQSRVEHLRANGQLEHILEERRD